MLGVDFVISALFDTSGFRGAGDRATMLLVTRANKTKWTTKELIDFTVLILLRSAECESREDCRTLKHGSGCNRKFLACVLECRAAPPPLVSSLVFLQVLEQLLS